MAILQSAWLWISGSIVSIFVLMRGIILFNIRLRGRDATILYEMLKERGKVFDFEEELGEDTLPKIYSTACSLERILFFFKIEERMLKAGFSGTDSVATVTLARWNRKRLVEMIRVAKPEKNEIGVYILQPWDSLKIGTIKIDKIPELFMEHHEYDSIEAEVQKVIDGDVSKTGIILYGPPGNGKSFFIRYLALKYRLPIYIVSLMSETDNHSLIRMFGYMKGPAIVLFEDFDNYFDKRKSLLNKPKFTFDTILNVIDGVFSTPHGIVFAMTANDLNKVDYALKSRPSRFRFVRRIAEPTIPVRKRIFTSLNELASEAVRLTEGYSLDMLLFVRSRIEQGVSLGDSLEEVKQYYIEVEEQKRIEKEERLKKEQEENKPQEGRPA